jgi:hypothetical protein
LTSWFLKEVVKMKGKHTKFDSLLDWISAQARPILIVAVLLGILDLIFLRMTILLADAPRPTPTATAGQLHTPTPTTTATPVVEPTWTPLPTETPTVTPIVEPTSTATPLPTSTPVVWPTYTPTPAITDWRGEYFDNTMLSGMPALVRNDAGPDGTAGIDFTWGYAAPADGLPVDGFSVRWTRAMHFDGGLYRFRATMDDGMRVYLDGETIIDALQDGAARERTVDLVLSAGFHKLIVVYYERNGTAVARLSWEKLTTYPDWKGEYWPNLKLEGQPALVRNDQGPNGTLGIDFNWKQGSPGTVVPDNGFSARWTRKATFERGTYRFHALVDDGVRLWVDGQRIIDAWSDHSAQEFVTDLALVKGEHTLKVEYYERIGQAQIKVWWEKVASPAFPDWKGEYWSNRTLSGDAALVRNDPGIDFTWPDTGPAFGLPADQFSARWTRTVPFDAVTYRFHALVDDGVRLWVDERLLIDAWTDHSAHELTADLNLVRGAHAVKVEYYEQSGQARIKVWWEKIDLPFADWKGEYWPNTNLSGAPSMVRNDKNPDGTLGIDFNWGTGTAATGLPQDNFAVRWSRQAAFSTGVYRFYALADDAVRVYLDQTPIINEWHGFQNRVYQVDLPLSGTHSVRIEYAEYSGNARA